MKKLFTRAKKALDDELFTISLSDGYDPDNDKVLISITGWNMAFIIALIGFFFL